jgi:hypothetical protein
LLFKQGEMVSHSHFCSFVERGGSFGINESIKNGEAGVQDDEGM